MKRNRPQRNRKLEVWFSEEERREIRRVYGPAEAKVARLLLIASVSSTLGQKLQEMAAQRLAAESQVSQERMNEKETESFPSDETKS